MTSTKPSHYRAYNGQSCPTSEHFSWLKTAYSARNGAPMKAEKRFLHPFFAKKREMDQPVLTKAFLQPAKTATVCATYYDYTHPSPSIPPFLLAQILSSKQIAPTDNR